eukprot:5933997-Ditylum_brightwellii.AAC.1
MPMPGQQREKADEWFLRGRRPAKLASACTDTQQDRLRGLGAKGGAINVKTRRKLQCQAKVARTKNCTYNHEVLSQTLGKFIISA